MRKRVWQWLPFHCSHIGENGRILWENRKEKEAKQLTKRAKKIYKGVFISFVWANYRIFWIIVWNKDVSMRFIALRTYGCVRKKRLLWLSGLSVRLVTHKGVQVACRHYPVLLVSKSNISNTLRDYNVRIITLANGYHKAQLTTLRLNLSCEYIPSGVLQVFINSHFSC